MTIDDASRVINNAVTTTNSSDTLKNVFLNQIKQIESVATSNDESREIYRAKARQFEKMVGTIARLIHNWNARPMDQGAKVEEVNKLQKLLDDDFIIRNCGLFDAEWYCERYKDIAAAGVDPVCHYIEYGAKELRDPGPFFSTSAYLARYPDIAAAKVNPLSHYIQYGEVEGRTIDASQMIMRSIEAWRERFLLEQTFQVPENIAVVEVNSYSPLISIIMPIYNTPILFLKSAIASIIAQSYTNWELIIVDDGSIRRDCVAAAKSYADQDSRVRVIASQHNVGIALASQLGLEHSSGDYVAFVDHDDILTPAALSHVVAFIRQNLDVDMIYTNHGMLSESGIPLEPSLKPAWSPEFFLSTNYIIHFKVVKRSTIIAVNGFIGTIHISQDVALTLRLIEADAIIKHLPVITYYWRMHAESVAVGVRGKPKIMYTGLKTIQDFMDRRGFAVDVEWPPEFQRRGAGVYKLNFNRTPVASAAIIVMVTSNAFQVQEFLSSLNRSTTINSPVHFITLPDVKKINITAISSSDRQLSSFQASSQADFDKYIGSLNCDIVVFITEFAFFPVKDWLKEILGYFIISNQIGAVGGKVLDRTMRLRSGATLLLPGLPTLGEYYYDNQDGYWHNNIVATNVEAVSVRFLALRRTDYMKAGGLPVFRDRDASGLAFCLNLRRLGKRVVFNPWAKLFADGDPFIPAGIEERLVKTYGDELYSDRYYPVGFRKSMLYSR